MGEEILTAKKLGIFNGSKLVESRNITPQFSEEEVIRYINNLAEQEEKRSY